MAITSADPDNDPNTPRPSISFGNASGGGSRSLRTEFPADTGSSSLSEYYRGGSVVPSSTVVGSEEESVYGSNELIESRYSAGSAPFGSGTRADVNNNAPDYLYYVRKVKSVNTPVPPIRVPIEPALSVNEWRITYNQSQGGGAYIRIYYESNLVYTGNLISTLAAEDTTELTVNVNGTNITFAKGTQFAYRQTNTGAVYQRDYGISEGVPVAVGDLLFAWQYETADADDKHGYTFKIPNGNVGEEYEHTDGYTYTTGPDASGASILLQFAGEAVGFVDPDNPDDAERYFEYMDISSRYNLWYDRYYIKRRTTANANNEQTVPLNNLVPTSGSISFSQLYGSRNFFEGSANIQGHNTVSGDDNKHIWEASNYPANITTDGTDVRSGVLPDSLRYNSSAFGTLPSGFTTFNVPLGTFYIDPATFIGNIKLTLSPLDSATTDIRYYGSVDDDNGDYYILLNEVGIRIRNVDSGNDLLVYKGETSPQYSGEKNGGESVNVDRFLSVDDSNVRTNVSEIITETGRFIVYLTFGYKQLIAWTDPDFDLNIDAVKVSWETA
jgi:hypothetical protein